MPNHPNRRPQHDEPLADLVARRPERLNILVAARSTVAGSIDARGRVFSDPRSSNVVILRYGYSPLVLDGDPRPTGAVVPCRPDGTPDADAIRTTVAALRAAWGPLHVQDNSGAVPDLEQGRWRG